MPEEQEEYEVEKVLAKKGGKYHVMWKGYPISDATWEPAEHLAGAAALIAAFEAAQAKPKRKAPPKKKKAAAGRKKPKTSAAAAARRKPKKAANRALAPPDTTVAEDDGAVDAYNENVARDDHARQHGAAAAALATGSRADYVAQVVKDVKTVVANIESGDCPYEVERAWVWCSHDDHREPGGILVLVEEDHMAMIESFHGTEDAETLRFLGEEGALHDAAKELGIDMWSQRRLRISAAAIARAVDMVVDEGRRHGDEAWIVPKDAERLKRKFNVWLHGATWGQT